MNEDSYHRLRAENQAEFEKAVHELVDRFGAERVVKYILSVRAYANQLDVAIELWRRSRSTITHEHLLPRWPRRR